MSPSGCREPFVVPFEGGRVRPWATADTEAMVRHADNPRVARFLSMRFPSPYTREDAALWFAFLRAQDDPEGWAIEIDGEAVGGVGFRRGEGEFAHSAELGYWLGEAHWGRGVMTRVVRAVLPVAVRRWGLARVTAYAATVNDGSVRVLEKAGFCREGTLRARAIRDGEVQDQLVFGWVDEARLAEVVAAYR
ncbi:GNAT family N-acetyltransferase [Silanimonas sp.]|jgi:ribosomal-protein-alanine N-acetyltransferase|uniref:GNAT family N-acetyltransferase n=1 Tax=Silanimonas sp. TaxID=1929290 RepID=UPI0022C0A3A1|nr:GNAT family N-acetyltransferase [Silanimonas sp.]MCZ8114463.1 GNAT family N-acetyltransferase [Silanimonas sp.]